VEQGRINTSEHPSGRSTDLSKEKNKLSLFLPVPNSDWDRWSWVWYNLCRTDCRDAVSKLLQEICEEAFWTVNCYYFTLESLRIFLVASFASAVEKTCTFLTGKCCNYSSGRFLLPLLKKWWPSENLTSPGMIGNDLWLCQTHSCWRRRVSLVETLGGSPDAEPNSVAAGAKSSAQIPPILGSF